MEPFPNIEPILHREGPCWGMSFTVIGTPRPWARPRPAAGRRGMINPKSFAGWQKLIILAFKEARMQCLCHGTGALFPGAVLLNLIFYFARPARHYHQRRGQRGEVRGTAPTFLEATPDLDNLEKAVLDALTRAGAWTDDARVVEKHSQKRWAHHDCLTIYLENVPNPFRTHART